MYAVLFKVLKPWDLKGTLKTCQTCRDGRAVYFRVLKDPRTRYVGDVLHELTSISLSERADPTVMIEDIRSLHVRRNRKSAGGYFD